MGEARQVEAYVEHVVALLSAEFGWSATTAGICRRQLLEGGPLADAFEFICDEPLSACWRLRADPSGGPLGLRMAYYGRSPEGEERAARITNRLAEAVRRRA